MDPTTKSLLTSFAAIVAGGIAAWAAKSGLIPSGDQSVVTNDLVSALFGGIAILLAWWKSRSHTKDAQIAAVNAADNGAKVVPNTPATANIPTVTVSLK